MPGDTGDKKEVILERLQEARERLLLEIPVHILVRSGSREAKSLDERRVFLVRPTILVLLARLVAGRSDLVVCEVECLCSLLDECGRLRNADPGVDVDDTVQIELVRLIDNVHRGQGVVAAGNERIDTICFRGGLDNATDGVRGLGVDTVREAQSEIRRRRDGESRAHSEVL